MSDIRVIVADGITPELRRIAKEVGSQKLMKGLGKELEIQLRKHFMVRDAEPNAMGWPSKHFWREKVYTQTALSEFTDNSATVSISSPEFAHKVLGGPIRSKRGKRLSIPKTAAAYLAGSASFWPGPKSELAKNYAFVWEVNQPADPRAWPEKSKLEDAILARARKMLLRLQNKAPLS